MDSGSSFMSSGVSNTHQVLKKEVNMGWGSKEKHEGREEDVLEGGEEDASDITISGEVEQK